MPSRQTAIDEEGGRGVKRGGGGSETYCARKIAQVQRQRCKRIDFTRYSFGVAPHSFQKINDFSRIKTRWPWNYN